MFESSSQIYKKFYYTFLVKIESQFENILKLEINKYLGTHIENEESDGMLIENFLI
jgi:hypothetical protein